MRVLIIQQKMIGDVLISTILCENIKKKYPDCTIDFIANANTLAVLENNPFIDNIIIFEDKYRQSKLQLLKFLIHHRKTKYTAVVDCYAKLESNLISLFSSAKLKISYKKSFSKLIYNKTFVRYLQADPHLPLAIKNRLALLSPLNITIEESIKKPKIYLTNDEIDNSRSYLENNGIDVNDSIIMISVLGSNKNKTYPYLYMAKIIDNIAKETNAVLLFNYIPSQRDEALKIYELCNEQSKKNIKVDVIANSLRDFLGVLIHCKAIIGNEGGAVNMGKALEKPSFCLFTPSGKKEGWSVSNDNDHIAIHLKDFKPALFERKSKKELIKEIDYLYQQFNPELFTDKLIKFIKNL